MRTTPPDQSGSPLERPSGIRASQGFFRLLPREHRIQESERFRPRREGFPAALLARDKHPKCRREFRLRQYPRSIARRGPAPRAPFRCRRRARSGAKPRCEGLEISRCGEWRRDRTKRFRGAPRAARRRSPYLRRPSPLPRSEEHTSELQSHHDLVCRLLLEKKKKEKTQ